MTSKITFNLQILLIDDITVSTLYIPPLSLLSLDIYPTLFHMRARTHTHVLHTQFKALETNFSEYHPLSSSRTVEFGDNILFYQYWYWQNPLADGSFQPEETYSYFSGKENGIIWFCLLENLPTQSRAYYQEERWFRKTGGGSEILSFLWFHFMLSGWPSSFTLLLKSSDFMCLSFKGDI